ncbi:MAG: hypothetical protein PHF37_01880 [Phycisphaerae bacterium]|nr:hypothetical protein [Phycisphaerae bacterium]
MTKNQINIARVIYDAYPHADLLPIDPEKDCRSLQTLLAKVTTETIGDGLFTFLVVEIVEGGEGNMDGAIRVMERVREDVESVLQALYDAIEQNEKQDVNHMKLYEVQATEYNGEQQYSQTKLVAARNAKHASQIARDYFRQWYDDSDDLQDHNTDNPDEFEFICGCVRLRIKSVQNTTLDKWIRTQIELHSIAELPDDLRKPAITRSADKLLEACKVLTSYTMDLLYKLDDQVNIADIEEIQQAKDAIARYTSAAANQL